MGREITLINGQKRTFQRPPKFVLWKHNRTGTAFTSRVEEIAKGNPKQSFDESGQTFLETMTDEEGEKFEAMTDDIVRHSYGKPYLESADLVKPEDYWRTVAWVFYATPDAPVETTEGETTVETVEKFHSKRKLRAARKKVQNLPGQIPGSRNGASRPHPDRRREHTGERAVEA